MMFWRVKGRTPDMSVKMMKAWLGVRDDLYEDTRFFTSSIVKKAVKEINTKNTNLNIVLKVNKKGKNTHSYNISVLKDCIGEVDGGNEQDQENLHEVVEELDGDGEPPLKF